MMQARPGLTDYALLCALAAMWGGSFMLIKVAGADFPPFTMTALRLIGGAALLIPVAFVLGERLTWNVGTLVTIALIGLFGNALPFSLITWGERTVDAGLAAILMGIMPIATLLLAHFFSDNETLTTRKVAGVCIGFTGLVVLTGPAVLRDLGNDGIRQLAILAAAICYAIGAIMTKRLVRLPRRAAGAAILTAGAMLTLPFCLVIDDPFALTPGLVPTLAVVTLALLPTALAALLMFAVLERQGAGFFGQVNLLVPLFGVAWAAIILSERPTVNAYIALSFILAGIIVARGGRFVPERVQTPHPESIEVK